MFQLGDVDRLCSRDVCRMMEKGDEGDEAEPAAWVSVVSQANCDERHEWINRFGEGGESIVPGPLLPPVTIKYSAHSTLSASLYF